MVVPVVSLSMLHVKAGDIAMSVAILGGPRVVALNRFLGVAAVLGDSGMLGTGAVTIAGGYTGSSGSDVEVAAPVDCV
jgi:hypothetical protein